MPRCGLSNTFYGSQIESRMLTHATREKPMNAQIESTIILIAALLVLLSFLFEPPVAAVLASFLLLAFSAYQFLGIRRL